MVDLPWCNHSRFDAKRTEGFYESWFLRANDPQRARALWVRYTLTVPRSLRGESKVDLWAIAFDGDRQLATRESFPARDARISLEDLAVSVGSATLTNELANGSAGELSWALHWDGAQRPALLLPERLYRGAFPRAKVLTSAPNARFHGLFHAFGERWVVEGWQGAQAHNWGSEHTARYAWGQVCGFDEDRSAFLECATARVRMAGLLGPPLTTALLRVGEEEYAFTGLLQAARARGVARLGEWTLETEGADAKLQARFTCPSGRFVSLRYPDPPGGERLCLNTKLARCELTLERPDRPPLHLSTAHGAAFELIGHDEEP